MANFFCSAGYSLEKLHTGMIVYLCDLWNEGIAEPLESFTREQGISINGTTRLHAVKEYKHIDLVVFDALSEIPLFAVEMKVDGHESHTKAGYQTIAYPELVPKAHFMFVTLGVGEYHREPRSSDVTWLRIRDFYEALNSITTADPLIEDWKAIIENEISLQNECFSNNPNRVKEHRHRANWNLYLLGHLREKLAQSELVRSLQIDPTTYTAGPGPDTILNFGWIRNPVYLEINNNGFLNLKMNFQDLTKQKEKEQRLREVETKYQALLKAYNPELNDDKLNISRKSRTIMSFNVGLKRSSGNLIHTHSETSSAHRIVEILQTFFG